MNQKRKHQTKTSQKKLLILSLKIFTRNNNALIYARKAEIITSLNYVMYNTLGSPEKACTWIIQRHPKKTQNQILQNFSKSIEIRLQRNFRDDKHSMVTKRFKRTHQYNKAATTNWSFGAIEQKKGEPKLISIAPKWRRKKQATPTFSRELEQPVCLLPCPPGAVLILPGTNQGQELSTCIQSQLADPLQITTRKHKCNPRLIYNGMELIGNKS